MKQLRLHPARTVGELRHSLLDVSDNLTPDDCQKILNTIPKRIQSVLKNTGYIT